MCSFTVFRVLLTACEMVHRIVYTKYFSSQEIKTFVREYAFQQRDAPDHKWLLQDIFVISHCRDNLFSNELRS